MDFALVVVGGVSALASRFQLPCVRLVYRLCTMSNSAGSAHCVWFRRTVSLLSGFQGLPRRALRLGRNLLLVFTLCFRTFFCCPFRSSARARNLRFQEWFMTSDIVAFFSTRRIGWKEVSFQIDDCTNEMRAEMRACRDTRVRHEECVCVC